MLELPSDSYLLERMPVPLPLIPINAGSWFRRGVLLQALGYDEKALESLRNATILDWANPNTWFQYGMVLSLVGREEQSLQAYAAAQELRPRVQDAWFSVGLGDHGLDTSLKPFATLSRAVWRSAIDGDPVKSWILLDALVAKYGHMPETRVRRTVSLAMISKSGLLSSQRRPVEALEILDGLIAQSGDAQDMRLTSCVASALVGKSALLLGGGYLRGAIGVCDDVIRRHGHDPATLVRLVVARALGNKLTAHLRLGEVDEGIRVLDDLFERYGDTADVELRRRAAHGLVMKRHLLVDMGRDDAALQTLEVLVDYYHHDPDPTIAAAATGAQIDRWLATRRVLRRSRWLSSAVREPILGLSGLIFRTRRKRQRELEYPQARDGPRHILVGRSLVVLGRVVQIGAVIAASIVGWRSYDAGNFTSIKVVLAIGLLACGQVVVLLGKRLQGRFSPQMVRYTRPILPSTIFALALTLVVAWVSPFLERAGTAYVTALPVETYRWFLDRGLPTWAGIIAMVPLAPIEIFFILYIFTSVVLKPLGHLLGQHNALVEALEESFGSAWIE